MAGRRACGGGRSGPGGRTAGSGCGSRPRSGRSRAGRTGFPVRGGRSAGRCGSSGRHRIDIGWLNRSAPSVPSAATGIASRGRRGLSSGSSTVAGSLGFSQVACRPTRESVRCLRFCVYATLPVASALATNVHRFGHAALGFGRPQRCWRSLRMRARSRRWAASTSGWRAWALRQRR